MRFFDCLFGRTLGATADGAAFRPITAQVDLQATWDGSVLIGPSLPQAYGHSAVQRDREGTA